MPGIPDPNEVYSEIYATRIMVVRLLTVVSGLVADIKKEKSAREILVDIADLADKDADNLMLHGLDEERERLMREKVRSKMQAIVVSATTGLIE